MAALRTSLTRGCDRPLLERSRFNHGTGIDQELRQVSSCEDSPQLRYGDGRFQQCRTTEEGLADHLLRCIDLLYRDAARAGGITDRQRTHQILVLVGHLITPVAEH